MKPLHFVLLLVLVTAPAMAVEYWVVQADAPGYQTGGSRLRWRSDVLFHNRGAQPAEVRILGISNETQSFPRSSDRFSIPPHRSTSLKREFGVSWDLHPLNSRVATLWVLHLDAPTEVIVDGTLEVGEEHLTQEFFTFSLGRLPIPAWPSLTPPSTPHVHLGADLGDIIHGRVNVGIYNASPTQEAEATIEIHRACDDSLQALHTVSIPPNTIQQFGNIATVPFNYCNGSSAHPTAHVTVTADQPHLSYVAVLGNHDVPTINTSLLAQP